MFTHYSELEAGDVDGMYDYEIKPLLHEYASFAFEDVCRQFVQMMQKKDALPFHYSKMGRWIGKTTLRDAESPNETRTAETEIDIVAVSGRTEKYLIGECKFKNRPFCYGEYLDTLAKLSPQKEKADFYYMLFSASGFDERVLEAARTDSTTRLYSLPDIVGGRCVGWNN